MIWERWGLEKGGPSSGRPMTLGHGPIQAALVSPRTKLTFSACSIMWKRLGSPKLSIFIFSLLLCYPNSLTEFSSLNPNVFSSIFIAMPVVWKPILGPLWATSNLTQLIASIHRGHCCQMDLLKTSYHHIIPIQKFQQPSTTSGLCSGLSPRWSRFGHWV